jgi:group I intron endonuclease
MSRFLFFYDVLFYDILFINMGNDINIWEEKNLTEPEKNCLSHNVCEQNDIIHVTKIDLIKNRCENIGKISGIYAIVNKLNNKYYIGSSKNIKRRWDRHMSELKMYKHANLKLQNAYNKYGRKSFVCVILKLVNPNIKSLLTEEQRYLDMAFKHEELVYNICPMAQIPPNWSRKKHKEETKIKMRLHNHNLGKPLSKKTKKLISKNRTGKFHTEEFKNKRSIKYTGVNNPNYGNHKIAGKNHPLFDNKKYDFYNKKLNTQELCTRYELRIKYNLDKDAISKLIYGVYKSTKGWVLNK